MTTPAFDIRCTCGHPAHRHDADGCHSLVFGVPYRASVGRCSCSQLIGEDYQE